jgi:hypothetical protein
MVFARVEEDAFGGRGLAGVHVGDDADVPESSCVRVHGESFFVGAVLGSGLPGQHGRPQARFA